MDKLSPDEIKAMSVVVANTASAIWDTFCEMDAPTLPANDIDGMQVELCRWQRRNFGDVSPVNKVDLHMGLGIIEEFGEALEANEIHGSKGKLDGLGDVCVYTGQLLIGNRMAIRPILEYADALAYKWTEADAGPQPTTLMGMFAHTLLKRDQRIRGYDKAEVWRPALTYYVAGMIAYTVINVMAEADDVGDDTVTRANLIERTYMSVAAGIVLKRNWTQDRVGGGQSDSGKSDP